MKEKRSYKRYSTKIDAIQKTSDGYLACKIKNISAGGIFVETPNELKTKTSVTFMVDHVSEMVPMSGRVVWAEREEDKSIYAGVEFENLTDRAKAMRDDILLSLMYEEHMSDNFKS